MTTWKQRASDHLLGPVYILPWVIDPSVLSETMASHSGIVHRFHSIFLFILDKVQGPIYPDFAEQKVDVDLMEWNSFDLVE